LSFFNKNKKKKKKKKVKEKKAEKKSQHKAIAPMIKKVTYDLTLFQRITVGDES
jgi:hypothetical protein